MHRIFLGLAVTTVCLLLASFVLGLEAAGETAGKEHVWRDVHFLMSLLTVLVGLLVHSIVFTYFLGTGRWVKEVARVYGLPDWVYAQAVKNKWKALPFELGSMAFGITSLAMGPEDSVISASADGEVSIWLAGQRYQLMRLSTRVTALAVGPHDAVLDGDARGMLVLWDEDVTTELSGHAGLIRRVDFRPDGGLL